MAKLTGLQIQKLLPKTNCKECGSNTCLAFAMKLAAQQADLSQCPYASDEAKRVLGAAGEPPVRSVALGCDKRIKVGEEICLYRHEKTFVNQTVLAVNLNDNLAPEEIEKRLDAIRTYELNRVGELLRIEMVAVTQTGENPEPFVALAEKAWRKTKRPLALRGKSAKALAAAAIAVKGSRSLLVSATPENWEEVVGVAKECDHAVAVSGASLDDQAELAAKIKESGFNDLILELNPRSSSERFQIHSILRRAALKDSYKPVGYATISFLSEREEPMAVASAAMAEICKYGGICVLPEFERAQIATLMALRQNIYTDPQKPIQVEPKVYPIGEPNENSPIFITTNFSLTYFIVSGEIENSGTSAWLVIPECEGMSVLTAWAAGKFSGATIGKFIRGSGLEERVKTRSIVIPGYVAQISGELEENLPGWKVVVGPQEAGDIEGFVKARLSS